jgi:hypothetical protein
LGRLWVTVNGKRKRTAAGVKHEYEKFQSSAKARAERSARTVVRRRANASGRTHKGDGKEIDHINSTPTDNRASNLRVVSRRTNRSKTENSRKRGSGRNRARWGL